MKRAKAMLMEELEDPARVDKIVEVDVDYNDTVSEWWTGAETADSDLDVEERLYDLFTTLQLAEGARAPNCLPLQTHHIVRRCLRCAKSCEVEMGFDWLYVGAQGRRPLWWGTRCCSGRSSGASSPTSADR